VRTISLWRLTKRQVALGNKIVPASAFAVVSLFVIIRQPFTILPMAITQFTRALVMGRRFDKLFAVPSSQALLASQNASAETRLLIRGGKFSWTRPDKPERDKDFTLDVPELELVPGELLAIVGKVAAGKSSLCSALLCEMTKLEGTQARPSAIAVCLQDAFILNDTVRANILFGQPYDAARYDDAVNCSALKRDLETFPGGDAAEIGERGINLSGGQKARVALARAAFSNAQVVILDDVLAAVDAEVGCVVYLGGASMGIKRTDAGYARAYIFEHMLLGAMKGRTRIVVTNNLDLLERVDRIAVLDRGRLVEVGSRVSLLGRGDSHLNALLAQMSSRQPVAAAASSPQAPPLLAQHSMPDVRPAVVRTPAALTAQRSMPDVKSATAPATRPSIRGKDEFVSSRNLVETAQSRMVRLSLPRALGADAAGLRRAAQTTHRRSKRTGKRAKWRTKCTARTSWRARGSPGSSLRCCCSCS